MRLPYSIAITLAFITCLSSFMLGLGQNDFMLPLMMFLASITSLYVTDFRRWIRLGDWTVNVLVLLVVFLTIGDIVRNQGEDLAFSIARILVFVEMVLLFREKDPRFCWQILLISLLQVVVAAVMQQSLLFGFLLIVYVFSGLCAFVLIFLQRENIYFRRHSFLSTFFDSVRAEIAARQDRGRLVRIALVTLITGPLSLVFSFSPTSKTGTSNKGAPRDPQSRWEALKSFFAVFPGDRVQSGTEHWESIDDAVMESKAWYELLWADETEPTAPSKEKPEEMLTTKTLVPVPSQSAGRLPRQKAAHQRFPLLAERPAFSAGTMNPNGLEGGRRELFRHLVLGTFFSLLIAVVLFCSIPRIGKFEMWGYTFNFGHDNWSRAFQPAIGTVGFKEEVRLGSLGTILPYHREVMNIRFLKNLDRHIPPPDTAAEQEVSYDEIRGATLYLRGIALENYANGVWTPQNETFQNVRQGIYGRRRRPRMAPDFPPNDQPRPERANNASGLQRMRPGATVSVGEGESLFFEKGSDLVSMRMVIRPLDTTVFFAPWPFFCRNDSEFRSLSLMGGSVNEMRAREGVVSTTIFTTAFKHGLQLAVTPCQEMVVQSVLLQVPEEGLEALVTLARKWDEESGLPKEDLIGRAMNLEQRFLASDQFQYKLGGTIRDFNLDPLEDFIDKNPAGHCEYFAGALAMMLRSVGIGSRVVVGFKSNVLGAGNQGTSVRQSDAHAWVEAYLPPKSIGERVKGPYGAWWRRGGWLRLDPTPAAAEQSIMKTVTFGLTDLDQWIQSLWSEFVLNMNATKQNEWIYYPLRDGADAVVRSVFNFRAWRGTVDYVIDYYRKLLFQRKDTVWNARDWALLVLPVVILLAIVFLLWRLARSIWLHYRGYSGPGRRRRASIDFYVRMERLLARRGRHRERSETPREFALRVGRTDLTGPVVDAFYRVRFGGEKLTGEELKRIREILDKLERVHKETGA